MSSGRRRTDDGEAPWPGGHGELSDHPTAPGRSRADRRRDGLLDPAEDPGRRTQPGQPSADPPGRAPLPPVRPVATGPRTTMAPFQPAPQGDAGQAAGRPAEDLWGARAAPPTPQPPAPGPRVDRRSVPPRPVEPRAVEPRPVEPRAVEPRAVAPRETAARAGTPRPVAPRPPAAAPAEAPLFGASAVPARPVEARLVSPPAVEERPARAPWDDVQASPWSTGPAAPRALPPAVLPSRAPGARPGPAGASGPAYGDWTRPSQSGSTGENPAAERSTARPLVPPAPETTAIPERGVASSRATDEAEDDRYDRYVDDRAADDLDDAEGYPAAGRERDRLDDEADLRDREDPRERDGERYGPATGEDAFGPATGEDAFGPGTGENLASVTGTIGGRAALRAERQAAEVARRKSTGRKGASAAGGEPGVPRRSPRRAATGLVAVAVVALGVLGVYSFASPDTRTTSIAKGSTPTVASAPPAAGVSGLSDLPPLSTGPISAAAPTSSAPIRLPVTVLNETDVSGLAANIAGVIKNGGWPTTGVGAYGKKDVAASTVFFTQGDENQRQSALQLIAQFPQLQGPTPRFFDVPGNASPGLVVVAAGEWKP